MVSLGDFSRIVSAIHAAAITPQHWIEAMEAARATFASTSAGMIMCDGTNRVIKSASIPSDAERAYRDHYRRVDYVLDAVEHGPVGLIRGGVPLIELNARSEFNGDWMQPHHMDDGLFVRLTDGPLPTCFLVATSKQYDPFATPENVRLVSALVPHLQQALSTQNHLIDLVHKAADVAEAVDNIRHGVFVVGPASAVLYLNRVAEDIVAVGDGPFVRSGCLGINIPSADATLHRDIAHALGDESGARRGSSMLCPRTDGERSYVIHVVPFTSATPEARDPRALVIVIDPERQAEPERDLLNRLYGLTRAEAEVALKVMRGDGLKPISDEMSLSLATVKTHLQHVFCKTHTHRQAELVRLLMTLAP
ncbi:MAG TPA: helix-turn-helix transcriptional regulator [Mycobacterium sp.]|nr:helix-turn-helix transcriptional regulator [Mycobacterium sp.]